MSEQQTTTDDEPFWRKPLPPIPGPRSLPDPMECPAERAAETGGAGDCASSLPLADPYTAAKAAEHALIVARQEARECRDATLRARTAFAKALADWNSAGTAMTQEQQAREFIRTSNEDRARRAAAAGGAIVHPGVTRTAKAMAGGNQRRGGGGAFRRGPGGTQAFSKADAMTVEANRLRVAAAAAAAKPGGK